MARAYRNPHNGGTQLPLLQPTSSWRPPTELPDLRSHKVIAVDLETYDQGLELNRGPSWPQRQGHVCGVAVAWPGGSVYVPVRHPDTECHDPVGVMNWLADHHQAGVHFVFHNAHYDVGWIRAGLGYFVSSGIEDTLCQAVMLDEDRLAYDLDTLLISHGLPGKDDRELREALSIYGYRSTGDGWKSNLHKLPARYVGPYAEADAVGTLALFERQAPLLEADGVTAAYRTEMDLVPCVHEMRWRGVRVDVDRAMQRADAFRAKRDEVLADLSNRLAHTVTMTEVGQNTFLEKIFSHEGIPFPRTEPTKNHPEGQPSFTAGSTGWMQKHPHWLPTLIVRADRLHKAAKDFLEAFVVNFAHNGRLHASINQYKSDDGLGTKTHRFSYSDPPLQQMPSRDPEIMDAVRGCFLPEDGERWCRADISQQEYRLIVHFAEILHLDKSAVAGDRYRADPATDYHSMVAELTGLERKPAKDANFAKAFGAGVEKFASMINKPVAEAQAIMDQYDKELPFVSKLAQTAEGAAARRGYIRLIDGARLHYLRWEPRYRDKQGEKNYRGRRGVAPCDLEEAEARIADPDHPWRGGLRRAFTRKAGNALIQGSAARWTKRAMVDCWRAGICPLLQVHDELNISTGSEAEGHQLAQLMMDAVKLTVPALVEAEFGDSWGDAKHEWRNVT